MPARTHGPSPARERRRSACRATRSRPARLDRSTSQPCHCETTHARPRHRSAPYRADRWPSRRPSSEAPRQTAVCRSEQPSSPIRTGMSTGRDAALKPPPWPRKSRRRHPHPGCPRRAPARSRNRVSCRHPSRGPGRTWPGRRVGSRVAAVLTPVPPGALPRGWRHARRHHDGRPRQGQNPHMAMRIDRCRTESPGPGIPARSPCTGTGPPGCRQLDLAHGGSVHRGRIRMASGAVPSH